MAPKKNQLVKVEPVEAELVESLPPEARLPTSLPTTPAEFDRLLEQKLAELLARRDDTAFQPYLQSRRLYQELRKLQSVPERRVWSVHYERHSCTHCRTRVRPHSACGLCTLCYPKIFGQKRAIEKELSKGR
jgi:hypothetical protein